MLEQVALLPLPLWLAKVCRPLGHFGEVAYVASVCRFAERADALLAEGREGDAQRAFRVIAALEDPLIGELVDRYRVRLEQVGMPSPPSVQSEYAAMLETMSERERALHLARQVGRTLAGNVPGGKRKELELQLHELLKTARRHGPLSKREERTFIALEGRFAGRVEPSAKSH